MKLVVVVGCCCCWSLLLLLFGLFIYCFAKIPAADSSEGQLFLTSPHGSSHGLHLHLSPTFSNHSTHTSDHTSSRARITNELVRPSSVGSIRSSAHNRTKGLMGSALISTKAPIISAGGNVYGTTYALSKPSAPVITISMDTSVQPSAPVISSGVAISMDTETQPLTPVISGSTTSSIQPSAPLVSGTTISMDTATQSSTPVISGTTISKDTATHPVVSGNSISIDTATQPLTPVISGNTSFNSSNVPTAPVLTIPNESTNQLSIVGSSLGLPSELLGGRLSMNSAGSSSFASFSEGDTVQSALASALALHETSGGGVLSSSTVPPSLESSAITSLSQLTGQDLHGKRHREHGNFKSITSCHHVHHLFAALFWGRGGGYKYPVPWGLCLIGENQLVGVAVTADSQLLFLYCRCGNGCGWR